MASFSLSQGAWRYFAAPVVAAKSHRHLLREFIVRDLKGRFAGSIGGLLWTLINPLAMILIYMFVFSLVLRVRVTAAETGTDHFVIYFLAGFFPWLFFAEGLSRSVGSLLEHANLITKVVFPVELLPTAKVLSGSVVNAAGMLVFLIYLAIEGYAHLTWLMLTVVFALQLLVTGGISFLLAAANVFIRDIGELLNIALRVWFFATPIIYPLSMVPDVVRPWLYLNPMVAIVGSYRDAILLHRIEEGNLILAAAAACLCYAIGVWFFMRAKAAFGDVL